MRSTRLLWMVLAGMLALALVGCGRDEGGGGGGGGAAAKADPGITDKEVKLGGSYPFSGPASAYGTIGEGAKAYFKFLNAKGGAKGRKITFTTLDDGYEPPKALQNARRLIQQDKVFALFNTLGTPNNLAIWDFVNQQKVPHLFLATGASEWGADIAKHPYTIGWQPNYRTEAAVYANFLKKEKPSAKVAVLYQNDGFGKDLLGGFEEAIKGSGVKVIEKETYNVTDPTVAAPVQRLARSGADTFLNITTPKFSAQAIATIAKSDWKPLHILNNVGASKTLVFKPVGLKNAKGIVSTAYFKDPEDPQWADDAAMKEYKDALKKYSPKSNPDDPFNVYGWTAAQTMAKALEQMKEPTRASLMDAVRNLDLDIGTMLPGNKIQTGPDDGYPIEAMQIEKFDGQNWKLQGDLIEAKTQ
ncbi:MAG: ABC transporter substrate-binding protein [Actinomycetota bacterium]|nr:ABC transporter substrate-binding protein [Actinomycetota bacterium]